MGKNTFKEWFTGKAEKSLYIKTISLAVAILFLGIFLAAITYPRHVPLSTVQISELASRNVHPLGSTIYLITFVIAGLIIMPHGFYFYKILLPDVKIISFLCGVCIFLAGIGLILVGFFPLDVIYQMHVVGAVSVIGGIGLSCLLSVIPIICKLLRKAEWPKWWHLLFVYGPLIIVAVISVIAVGIPVINQLNAGTFDPNYPPPIWALCEWFVLSTAIIWAYGMVIIGKRAD
jgi:hypothetical protein